MGKKQKHYPRTDTGNAELIAALFGDVLRYDHRQGRWLIWSKRNRRWSEDKADRVRTFAIRAARYRRRVSARLADTETSKQEISWSFESEDRPKLDAALDIAKSLAPISDSGSDWDAHPGLFGVNNGVIDLRTGRLRAERPEDRITKHSRVSYDPDAKCPRFEQFLQEIFNGQTDLIDYVQRVAGYCLTGSVQEHCLFCFYGSVANGKSTLIIVLGYIRCRALRPRWFVIDGRPPVPVGAEPEAQTLSVMGDYFHVMQIPIRAGRGFTAMDREGQPLVAVVNEEMVRKFFPRENPLGVTSTQRNVRHRIEARQHLAAELRLGWNLRVACCGQLQMHGHHVGWVKSRIYRAEPREPFDQQAGSHEKEKRQGEFSSNQQLSQQLNEPACR